MSPGLVVSVRINPNDVMGVIDTLHIIGVPTVNLSFSQAVKLVLASYLESGRQNGIIPHRQGFEYLDMIKPFEQGSFSSRGAKLRSARNLKKPDMSVVPIVPETQERKARRIRYEEMLFKYKTAPDSISEEDWNELAPLLEEFQNETINASTNGTSPG